MALGGDRRLVVFTLTPAGRATLSGDDDLVSDI